MFEKLKTWFEGQSDDMKLMLMFWYPLILGVFLGMLIMYSLVSSKSEILLKRISAYQNQLAECNAQSKVEDVSAAPEQSSPRISRLYVFDHLQSVGRDAIDEDGIGSDVCIDHAARLKACRQADITGPKLYLLKPISNEHLQEFTAPGVGRFYIFFAHDTIVSNAFSLVTARPTCKMTETACKTL